MIRVPPVSIRNAAWPYQWMRMGLESRRRLGPGRRPVDNRPVGSSCHGRRTTATATFSGDRAMPNRRRFLAAGCWACWRWARRDRRAGPAGLDPTWLTYATDAERFWENLPFLERLRKLAEAGFTRYEFGRWKTKDIEAIAR